MEFLNLLYKIFLSTKQINLRLQKENILIQKLKLQGAYAKKKNQIHLENNGHRTRLISKMKFVVVHSSQKKKLMSLISR